MVFKKGHTMNKGKNNPMYGKSPSSDHRKKISKHHKEAYQRGELKSGFKKGNIPHNKGKSPEKASSYIAYERIESECRELEKQGFRVIPIGKVIPDIIAIKDNKVFAVEVEYGQPNYDKYNKIIGVYNDIIWIIKRRGKNGKVYRRVE